MIQEDLVFIHTHTMDERYLKCRKMGKESKEPRSTIVIPARM